MTDVAHPQNDSTPAATTSSLYIDGAARSTVETTAITDPARPTRIVGRAAAASTADVADAVTAAKGAFAQWSALTPQERARLMTEAVADIATDRDGDAALLSRENGKIVAEAWVDALVFELRWRQALTLADQVDAAAVLHAEPGVPVETTVTYQPLGVVTVIVPFNWPLAILAASLPYALLAGNTVIVKPPLTAPLATARLVQRVAERLPAGVLNVVTGADAHMTGLIRNDDVAKVCFTGSVGGGRRMMALAAPTLTRVTLELGGNDAAIVFDDAPLDEEHLDRLFHAVFDSTGQICMNAKRIYVHRSRLDELVAGLSERLEQVVLGDGTDPKTTMGPLHSAAQKEFVDALIAEAKADGADVREFGELPGGELAAGNFVRPAIVVEPATQLRVVADEQFGPVIPVIAFDDEAEAIRQANDSWAALGGSVWTMDGARARRVARQLVCGYVWVNDHGANRLDLRAPFGGLKSSGMGREQGLDGLRDFQDPRAVAVLESETLESA
ncbi:aldehyde dehydrogenase family protein [Pseudoclavibacter sp. 13-3]|uniref:aldehyde dehydrogenase family protein n=1 Tax=Pseudoclavibacter sp. 13-3 TaxID=2901228 RepID=UPI001E5526CA|nr:aldehyde dehydrogenase family protein [Pseudoclavibacter sp. 13-3]MCD7100786.1 aldehyde dehydrogenase family protein [Pseudoclavibacter sp. 13-3]